MMDSTVDPRNASDNRDETSSGDKSPASLPAGSSRSDSSPASGLWRGALIGATAIVLGLGALAAIWLLARPLAMLFAAIAIAEALAPVVDRLEKRMARSVAVILVYVALLAVIGGIGWLVVPRLVAQAEELAEDIPEIIERAPELINEWDPFGEGRILQATQDNLSQFSVVLIDIPFTVASSVVSVVLVIVMSAYWLVSAPALGRFFRSLLPPRMLPKTDEVLEELRESVGGYVRGEAIDAFIVSVIAYVGLLVIGVEYTVVLALIAGLGELVPVVGPILAGVPAVAVALLDSPRQAVIVTIFYVVLQQVESHILLPQVMSQAANVPPLLTVIAIFAGASLGGLLGALVAIPLAGALKVLTTSVIAPAIRRWSGGSISVAAGFDP